MYHKLWSPSKRGQLSQIRPFTSYLLVKGQVEKPEKVISNLIMFFFNNNQQRPYAFL